MTRKEHKPIRVLIVEDHIILRDGIVSLLSAQPDFEVVGEAGSVASALAKVRQTHPDLVLLDYGLPDGTGLEAAQSILADQPDVNIVFLTVHEEDDLLFSAIRSGAKGYLLKNISAAELLQRLRGLAHGEAPLSGLMTSRLLAEFARTTVPDVGNTGELSALTPREMEVLKLISRGASNKEIARQMVISLNTVKNHVHHILVKLELNDREEAARLAIEHRLFRPDMD